MFANWTAFALFVLLTGYFGSFVHDRGELHQHDGAKDPVTAIRWDLVGDGRLGPRGGGGIRFGGAQALQFTAQVKIQRV